MEKEDLPFKIIGIQKFFKIRSSVTPLLAKRAVTSWKTKHNLRLWHVMATYLSIDNSKTDPFFPLTCAISFCPHKIAPVWRGSNGNTDFAKAAWMGKISKDAWNQVKNIIRKNVECKVSVFILKAYWAMAWYGSPSSQRTSVSMDKEIVDKYTHLKTSLNRTAEHQTYP